MSFIRLVKQRVNYAVTINAFKMSRGFDDVSIRCYLVVDRERITGNSGFKFICEPFRQGVFKAFLFQ